MPELLDIIDLVVDLPQHGLYAGMQGTVVEGHRPGAAYAVELTDAHGQALALLTLRTEQCIVVWQAHTKQWIPLPQRVAELVARLPEVAGRKVLECARFISVRAARTNQPPLPTPQGSERAHR